MPESYYQPGAERAAKVRQLFGHIARRYDLLNDLQSLGLHRRWKRQVVTLAEAKAGSRALDLCCGTGDISFGLATHGAEVVGLDFTQAMLDQAKARQDRMPKPGAISFIQGDAQDLPFRDQEFDIITVGYGLRNLADWRKGIEEMVRVAKPGARLVMLEFGKPAFAPWRALYFGYLKLLVPVLGWAAASDRRAYSYILESLSNFPGQTAVEEFMRQKTLASVRTLNLLGGTMAINFGRKV